MSHDSPGYVAGRTRSSTLAAASTGQGQVFEPDFLLEDPPEVDPRVPSISRSQDSTSGTSQTITAAEADVDELLVEGPVSPPQGQLLP